MDQRRDIEHVGTRDERVVQALNEWRNTNRAWQYMDIRVEDAGVGWALLRMPFRAELLQNIGSVHGGFIAMLADSATGAAVWSTIEPDEYMVTVDLHISYLRPVLSSDLLASASVRYRGRTTATVECTVYNADSLKQVSAATALYMIRARQGRLSSNGETSPKG